MSVGQFLDQTAAALAEARERVEHVPEEAYAIAAVLTARDHLYQELGRFLTAIGVRPPPVTPALVDAETLIDPSSNVEPGTVLGSGLKAATFGLQIPDRALLRAPGTVSESLESAADQLSLATEILHTHKSPGYPQAPETARPMTREGLAIFLGAQRQQAIAEAAWLAVYAQAVDQRLVQLKHGAPDVLTAHQWDTLADWARSPFEPELLRLSQQRPATLLRKLEPAAPTERSTGPRAPQSWQDVIAAIDNARDTVLRTPNQATLGLAAAAARLGFGVTAVQWRLSGAEQPHTDTTAVGDRWRNLAHELARYADLRDRPDTAMISELQTAQQWVRQNGATTADTAEAQKHAAVAQGRLGLLCREIAHRIERAAGKRNLMIQRGHSILNTGARTGVQNLVAVPNWVPARHAAKLQHRLRAISDAHRHKAHNEPGGVTSSTAAATPDADTSPTSTAGHTELHGRPAKAAFAERVQAGRATRAAQRDRDLRKTTDLRLTSTEKQQSGVETHRQAATEHTAGADNGTAQKRHAEATLAKQTEARARRTAQRDQSIDITD
jgi:hypothetical protein